MAHSFTIHKPQLCYLPVQITCTVRVLNNIHASAMGQVNTDWMLLTHCYIDKKYIGISLALQKAS